MGEGRPGVPGVKKALKGFREGLRVVGVSSNQCGLQGGKSRGKLGWQRGEVRDKGTGPGSNAFPVAAKAIP